MIKKTISSLLVIILLTLSMPIQPIVELFTSYAATTEWQYNFTGNVQTLKVPYKGIYKIEAAGAQRSRSNH